MPTPKKPRRNCRNCGKKLSRPEKFYCNINCQITYEHKQFIDLWLKGEVSGTQSNGLRVSSHVRRWLIATRGNQCEICGWNERNPVTGNVPIEVSHTDGNSQNSIPSNLQLLCPNHHSLTPSFRNLNKGKGRKNRPDSTMVVQ